jgi:hypothetical protein
MRKICSYGSALALVLVGMWSGPALSVDALNVVESGKVGVGTATPTSEFEVFRTDVSDLMRLSNTGNVGFNMESRTAGIIWRFSGTPSSFRVSLDGSGGPEMKVNADGSVAMGPGGTANFDLDTAGNLEIAGTLTEMSSRTAKHDIEPVDEIKVLNALIALPIAEWSYSSDKSGARHLGPMAEDFSAAFGLGGSSSHLAPRDVAGVALAAVKAVAGKLQEKENRIERLTNRVSELTADYRIANERLRAENAALTSRLEQLEGVINTLAIKEPVPMSRKVTFVP